MKYYIRLDDASENMNLTAWKRVAALLNEWEIKPLFGIIPFNQDPQLLSKYEKNPEFWSLVQSWLDRGWTPALHGYDHSYCSQCSGINPVNPRSEFAGVSLDLQKVKIREGMKVLKERAIVPQFFFAPGHTFDLNTLTALKDESDIRIISDTMANNVYKKYDFYFIPVQSGRPRRLPFKCTTICLHPNTMTDSAFLDLEAFLRKYHSKIGCFDEIKLTERKMSVYDTFLQKLYYFSRRLKSSR